MFESDFCEYAVTKKIEGAYFFKICAAAVASLIFAVVFFTTILPKSGFTLGMLIFAAACVILWYLSRYTQIEHEYSISGGYMDFASVYVKQYRKEKLSVDLKKSARRIAPYSGSFDGFNVKEVLDMRSSTSATNAYYLVYEADKSQKAVLFDATKRSVDMLFHQIPSAVVRSNDLPEQ